MLARVKILLLLFVSSSVGAQEPLFTLISPPSPDVTPPPTAFAVYPSTFNHDGLKANPASIEIAIPRSKATLLITAQRSDFIPREGFSAVDQSPDPGEPPQSFAYSWVGEGDDYTLRVTFRSGAVAGILEGPEGRFEIQTDRTLELNRGAFPADDSGGNDAPGPDLEALSHVAEGSGVPKVSRASGPDDIDILVVYTEEARVAAGGPAGQCVLAQHSAGIRAIIDQAIVDTNIAFANSLSTTRLGNVHVMRVMGFPPPNGNPVDARNNALLSAGIAAARNRFHADVVSVVTDGFATLGACGIAVVQRPGCTIPMATPGCDVGPAFNAFAYNVVAQNCALATDAFAHELGHNLGGEHNPENGPAPGQASFGFSFGHFLNGAFETVMSVRRPIGTPQILNFSNPAVAFGANPTGIVGQRHVSLTIENLYPAFRQFRQGPAFADGFESAAPCPTVNF